MPELSGTFHLPVLHCRLMTQLAEQPGFSWNSCNIFFQHKEAESPEPFG